MLKRRELIRREEVEPVNEPMIFNYNGYQALRTVAINEEPWFVAKDVCDVLGTDTRDVSKILDADEVDSIHITDASGRNQEMKVINEAGLYSLTLRSRKPEAKTFKRWVTHDVIPSIRKHGAYMTPQKIEEVLSDPDTIIKLAQQLKQAQEEKRHLQAKVEADKPKVLFAEALEISNNSILVGQLAKLLKQNGIDIGQNRLFERLRDEGFLIKAKGERWNDPTQRSLELGLFETKRTTVNNPDGSVRVTKTTKVTAKGQIYFVNKFKSELVTTE